MIAGVDEAGRGALVGNVIAAAVILPASYELPGLTDSKKLSARQREALYAANACRNRHAQYSPRDAARHAARPRCAQSATVAGAN